MFTVLSHMAMRCDEKIAVWRLRVFLLHKGGNILSAYRKEIRSTIGFGVVYVLLGHTGLWAILLGTDDSIRVLGLPIHYFIAITLGSFGVLLCSIVWCRYANLLEDKIEAENAGVVRGDAIPDAGPGGLNFAEVAK